MHILFMFILLLLPCMALAEEGITSKPSIDRSEAIKLRKIENARQFEENKAKAEQGDAEAQALVGSAYIFTNGGVVQRDLAEAEKWLMKSADQGNVTGQVLAGLLYSGNVGNASHLRDYSKALRLFEKAAWQGEPRAYDKLAFMYYNGQGVQKDKIESLKWLCLAIKAYNAPPHKDAGSRMALSGVFFDIFEKLSPEEVAEARKRADVWEAALASKQSK